METCVRPCEPVPGRHGHDVNRSSRVSLVNVAQCSVEVRGIAEEMHSGAARGGQKLLSHRGLKWPRPGCR